MLCFSVSASIPHCTIGHSHAQVDSPDSLENVESKWLGEITEHCPGVDIVLVALKCDLRPGAGDEVNGSVEPKRPTLTYDQGLDIAKRIKALRYLGMRESLLYPGIHRHLNADPSYQNAQP